jgi:hypothetical protein
VKQLCGTFRSLAEGISIYADRAFLVNVRPAASWLLPTAPLIGVLFEVLLCFSAGPALAQQVPTASASSAATAAGTTVNNQNNSQINTNSFYGFGPGINCPTPTFSVAGFGGTGSGLSSGDVIGARVSSDNYGGIVTLTFPIGGAHAEICKEIGKAQVQALQSQVIRATTEARKTQADINLVTAIKCVEILRVASLQGQFAQLCQGVLPRGMADSAVQPVVRQRFEP